jgi:hypothetical protein
MGALLSPAFHHLGWLWATAIMGCMFFFSSGRRTAKRHLFALAQILILLLCGCGGSSGSQTNPNGTPAGTYQLTVTATIGRTTQSTVLNLTVQ